MATFRRRLRAAAILILLATASCRHESPLQVHYLPGLVPGTQRVFQPATITVLPVMGALAAGEVKVGSIYNPDGSPKTTLAVRDVGAIIAEGIARCFSDAGLKASLAVPGRAGPSGAAFTLATEIESISVDQRFAAEQTIHGQYFTMTAEVMLRFTLSSSEHPKLFSVVTTGAETEPPAPVGGEVFLPIETEPAESLSVALSRAIGALVLQPGFREALKR